MPLLQLNRKSWKQAGNAAGNSQKLLSQPPPVWIPEPPFIPCSSRHMSTSVPASPRPDTALISFHFSFNLFLNPVWYFCSSLIQRGHGFGSPWMWNGTIGAAFFCFPPPTPTFGPQLQTKDKPQPAHPHCLNFLAKLLKEKRILAKPFSPHWTTSGTQALAPAQQHLFIFPGTVRQNHQRLAQGTFQTQPIRRDPTPAHLTASRASSKLLTTPPLPSRQPHLTPGLLQSQLVPWARGIKQLIG